MKVIYRRLYVMAVEVPPDYDDAWNPDVSTDTDVSRLSHAGSTRRTRPAGAGRSASSRGSKQPPRARSHRSYSDAEGRRRMRWFLRALCFNAKPTI
jgi:hypothetical protein